MRGPSLQYDLRIHRTWKCSACGRVVCTRGRETSKTCSCVAPPVFMQLVEAPRRLVFDATAFVSPAEPEIDEDGPDGLEEATAAAMAAILARAEATAAPTRPSFAESLARLPMNLGQDQPGEQREQGEVNVPTTEVQRDDDSSPPVSQERFSPERPSAERDRSQRHRIPRQRSRHGGPAPEGADRTTPRTTRRPAHPPAPPATPADRENFGSGIAIGDTGERTARSDRRSSGSGSASEPERIADGAGAGGLEPADSGQKEPRRKSRRRRRQTTNTEGPAGATGGPAAPAEQERNVASSGRAASQSGIASIRPQRTGRANSLPSSAPSDGGETRNEASAGSENAPDSAVARRSRRRGRRRGQGSGPGGTAGGSANGATEAE